jgi:hypothetical protein
MACVFCLRLHFFKLDDRKSMTVKFAVGIYYFCVCLKLNWENQLIELLRFWPSIPDFTLLLNLVLNFSLPFFFNCEDGYSWFFIWYWKALYILEIQSLIRYKIKVCILLRKKHHLYIFNIIFVLTLRVLNWFFSQ